MVASVIAPNAPATGEPAGWLDLNQVSEPPFSLAANPKFVFLSRSYQSASHQIVDAVNRREGLTVLTGESGVGKTLLCRMVLQNLAGPMHLSFIVNPSVTPGDLLKQILTDFGAISHEAPTNGTLTHASCHDLLMILHRFLTMPRRLHRSAVVVVDDAHRLDPPVLETLRVLSNLETDTGTLIQIILVGQPEVDKLLRKPEGRQLDQRVSRRCRLYPMAAAEVGEYVALRLAMAQAPSAPQQMSAAYDPLRDFKLSDRSEEPEPRSPVSFSRSAIRTLAARSRRVPRMVNLIFEEALEIGFERKASSITTPMVLAAAMRLNMPVPVAVPLAVAWTVLSAALPLLMGARMGTSPSATSAPRLALPERPVTTSGTIDTEAAVIGTLERADAHLVVVASFKNARNAMELTKKLVSLGLPAFDRPDAAARWQVVFIGPYATVDEARDVQKRITALGFTDSEMRVERH